MTVEKDPPVADRILRSVTFLILFLAVFGSFFLRPEPKTDSAVLEDLTKTQSDLFFKFIAAGALNIDEAKTEEQKTVLKNAIVGQLQSIDSEPAFRTPEVQVQKRMVLAHLGEDIGGYDEKSLGPYKEAFQNLYADRSLPSEGDAILTMPATELAVLDYLKRNDPERYAIEHKKVKEKAASLLTAINIGSIVFLFIITLGLYGAVRFFFNRPPAYFGRFLDTVKPAQQPVFMETAILFLFVMFPVGMILSRFLSEQWMLPFNFVLIPAAFLISLLYFKSETRPEMLRWLFWVPVFDQVSSENDTAPTQRPFLPSLFKEIGVGIVAWAVIFPVGALATLIAVTLAGGEAVPSVHPIVQYVDGHRLEVFLLAVVIAPIVEEVIFRNFVYGFFRFRFQGFLAALFSGFFFAVIHPYSAVLMPQLTVLGAGLAILREHRPGIVAPIVTHMIVNGLAFLFMQLLF
ncbi:CPBP family intramembrane glutamic endopeptidase [Leptonema illini]|uniref:Abortive infection protein n=1 Tax=Leptonema illini DSM 21528 TaxID=929563 RepID=H2CFR6_9LEPT|nr:type II CAAX endopeptidase family protein [Leptonema illini]EHQ06765.1 Abortive infection protein [Leptonema illini DSM 21528]